MSLQELLVMPTADDNYSFTWGLNEAVTKETVSLTLIDTYTTDANESTQSTNLLTLTKIVVALLTAKKIQLPYIVLCDGFTRQAITTPHLNDLAAHAHGVWRCVHLAELGPVCHRLALLNYTVDDMATVSNMITLFPLNFPRTEAGFTCGVYHPASNRKTPVEIFYLVLQSADGEAGMLRQFLLAAEESCPPLDPTTYDRVRVIHRRWVDNLQYPDQWYCIRRFLQLYSSFRPDGSEHDWTDVDLRLLDVSSLTQLAVSAIDGHFDGNFGVEQ
ncbi:uncharacterized protein LOC129596651 [Paramacrobiotus metropolitanus]|uniref:uncharacterized protein LOC129596651 n=1 Tax=Paramacrobiotus metropolitanus TaxID=2943436 RepID=UPI0024464F1B|nr:uncharacterized protein LOC129596651 [Paramacrobiotus metropolitanus]